MWNARFFEPAIEPLIKSSGGGGGGATYTPRLPYTAIYLGGLRLGFTTEDLRVMPYQRLNAMLYTANEGIHTEPTKPKARPATQADIDRLLA